MYNYDVQSKDISRRHRVQVGLYIMRMYEPVQIEMTFYEARANADGSISITLISSVNAGFSLTVIVSTKDFLSRTQKYTIIVDNSVFGGAEDLDIFVRYSMNKISNDRTFFTDSNGVDLMERKYDPTRPTEMSYYPATKLIRIQDTKSSRSATVIVDRAVGVSSTQEGIIDVIILRINHGRDMMGANVNKWLNESFSTVHSLDISNLENDLSYRRQQILDDSPILYAEILNATADSIMKGLAEEKANKTSTATSRNETNPYIRDLLDIRSDGLMYRVYNMHDKEPHTIKNITEHVKRIYGIDRPIHIEERSIDYNNNISYVTDHNYRWRNSTRIKEAYNEETYNDTIILKPLKMKTYKIFIP
jgi:hypothetical protein